MSIFLKIIAVLILILFRFKIYRIILWVPGKIYSKITLWKWNKLIHKGLAHYYNEEYQLAKDCFLSSSEIVERRYCNNCSLNVQSLINLSKVYIKLSKLKKAEETIITAQSLSTNLFPQTVPPKGIYYYRATATLGSIYFERGKFQEAQEALQEAKNYFEEQQLTSSSDYTELLSNIGLLHSSLGNDFRAESYYNQSKTLKHRD